MILTGRLTGDATIHNVKDDRRVVNFSIAINDRFVTKQGERREVVTFVDCAYWLGSKVAQVLRKGTLVELFGRLGVDAYVNRQGEAVGRITCNTSSIKVLHSPGREASAADRPAAAPQEGTEAKEDLPF